MSYPPVVTLEDVRRREPDGPDAAAERLIDPWCGARWVTFRGRRYWVTAGQLQQIRNARFRPLIR